MARRRRRTRIGESQENLLDGGDELGSDEDDELDNVLSSLEARVREVELLAEVQSKDTQGMRARMEQFHRELKDLSLETPEDDELVEDVEKLERQMAALSQTQAHVSQQLGQLAVRLESGEFLGQVGAQVESAHLKVEELRAEAALALEQLMTRVGEELDSRFSAYDGRLSELMAHAGAMRDELSSGRVAPEINELMARSVSGMESRLEGARAELGGRFDEMHAAVAQEFEELTERLGQELGQMARLTDVDQRLQSLTSELEVAITDLRTLVEAGPSEAVVSEMRRALEQEREHTGRSLDEVRRAMSDLQSSVGDADGLAQRARAALEAVGSLESRYNAISERVGQAASLAEKQMQTVNLAIRLVEELDQKARGAHARVGGGGEDVYDPTEAGGTEDLGFEVGDLLQVMIKHNATDLHLKVGMPPMVRLDGELIPVGERVLNEVDCRRLVYSSMTQNQRSRMVESRQIDYPFSLSGIRFRINAFFERGNVSAALRALRGEMPSLDELGLPAVAKRLATLASGLVLVAGPTGSGKSTTLTALVDYINNNRKVHVLTVEETVEFYHTDKLSMVTQREVGSDVPSFAEGVWQALRQDPNVIVVGDLRDSESVRAAVVAASTGKLVLAGISSFSAVSAVDRILNAFSAGEAQRQVRQMLATSLRGVLGQRLLNRADGLGRVLAVEVLTGTTLVASHILEGQTHQIGQFQAQGAADGMQTLTQALGRLYEAGLISKEEAAYHAEQPADTRPSESGIPVPAASMTEDTLMNWL